MVPNMKAKYTADVAPALMKKFEYKSTMQIPTIDKIVVNVGCGKEANGNSKVIECRRPRYRGDHRPEAGHHPRTQVRRELQAPRGYAGRR